MDADLPEESGEDSFTLLPALLGQPTDYRPPIIHHSNSTYALHSRNWKIVFGQGRDLVRPQEGRGYLFELENDPSEANDLWSDHPEIVVRLTRKFRAIKETSN